MRTAAYCAMAALVIACGPSPDAKLPGYVDSAGGSTSSGTGGTTTAVGTGGRTGAGGGTTPAGTGGRITGTGGMTTVVGTGGRITGTGGTTTVVGTGGRITGTGGRTPGGGGSPLVGTGGGVGRDGGAGGITGTGGTMVLGVGGTIGRDAGAGGIRGTGGATTGKDAANSTDDAPGNCAGQVISNGYACGTVTSCDACPSGKAAPCKASLDCIAPKYPCDSGCMLTCFNNNAADSVAQKCVTDLLTAACGTGC